MNTVDLPYATSTSADLRDTSAELNMARQLVSQELHAGRGEELARSVAESVEAQIAIAEEERCFLEAMAAIVGNVADEDAVILSPLSGRRRHRGGEAVEKTSVRDERLRTWVGGGFGSLFPRVPVPRSDDEPSQHRTPPNPSSYFGNGEATTEAKDDHSPSQEALFPSSSSTPPPAPLLSAPASADAVYYEALLGQSIGARLFLAHNTLVQEGEAFLLGMQRTQDVLLVTRAQVDDINALRRLEQEEFSKSHQSLCSQIAKTRSKVRALEKTLEVPVELPASTKTVLRKKESLLTSLLS